MHSLYVINILSKPISTYPPHQHDSWEIVYYFEGEGTLSIDQEKINFSPGDMVFIPPYVTHSEIATIPFRNINFVITECDAPKSPILKVKDTETNDIYSLLNMLYREKLLKRFNEKSIVDKLFAVLDQYILAQTQNFDQDPIVDKCKHIIISNFADCDFNISSMLSEFDYSENYIRRIFKEFTGISPVVYLTQKRIEYAKQLIRIYHPDTLTLKQIALMCGFDDAYYFSRAFKKNIGMSPTEFSENEIKK